MKLCTVTELGVLAAIGATAIAGCQVYDPSLVERDGGPVTCELRRPPARPTSGDGDDDGEYIYALRNVVLDQGGGLWASIGLDLDGRCTQPPLNDTECRPPRGNRPPNDGMDGIDNVFGAELFPLVDLATMQMMEGSLEATARAAQELGKAPVVRIRGWNGEANDARVDVMISNSIFAVPAGDDGEPVAFEVERFDPVDPVTGDPVDPPAWDGNDYVYLRVDTFFEGDVNVPLIRDDNAYVADDMIVARLPERFEILFPTENLGVLVRLTDATAVGRISEDRTSLTEVTVSGRWRLLDLLATAENVGVCRGTTNYDLLLTQLDAIADLRATPGTGGEGVTCDAISTGVSFTGTRVRLGGLTEGPSIRNICSTTDGGVPSPDAGTPGTDAGTPGADAGTSDPDAGTTTPDTGPPDTGPPDAGPPDAGPPDAGPADAG